MHDTTTAQTQSPSTIPRIQYSSNDADNDGAAVCEHAAATNHHIRPLVGGTVGGAAAVDSGSANAKPRAS